MNKSNPVFRNKSATISDSVNLKGWITLVADCLFDPPGKMRDLNPVQILIPRNEEAEFPEMPADLFYKLRGHSKIGLAWVIFKTVKYPNSRQMGKEAPHFTARGVSGPELLIISQDDERMIKKKQRSKRRCISSDMRKFECRSWKGKGR